MADYGKPSRLDDTLGFARLATAIVLIIVVLIGGVVVIVQPATLAFDQYIRDVGIAAGLLGIGYGIDAHSKP